jgi:uncharacterized caspase-like protein
MTVALAMEATMQRAVSKTVRCGSSNPSGPVSGANHHRDLMEGITMPHHSLGPLISLALAFLWAPCALASPSSGPIVYRVVDTTHGAPERRTALVIGNVAYQENPRRTSVHDAVDMTANLGQLGFQVMELHDATKQRTDEAVTQFAHQLSSGGVGLFYFSGRGVEVRGRNYLLPVDARLGREADLEDQAVRLDAVLDRIRQAGNELNFIILDADRHNPYARGGRSDQWLQVPMLAHPAMLIAYATAPGMAVENGSGRNSVYTNHLLHFLRMPGLTVEQLFKEVRMAVARETGGRQIPWVSSSVLDGYSFSGW